MGLGAAAFGGIKDGKGVPGADIFAGTNVVRIQIEIPAAGLDALRNTFWRNGEERPVVKATVKEGGAIFTNVALHLKGSAGSFRAVDDDPCLTLNFRKFAPGQTFHGLYKISLNNSVQDPSYLTEKICREMFEAAGVPATRAGHATLTLNGRDLGLRVLTEGFNKQFLKRYFKNTQGSLYDGGFVQDITGRPSVISGEQARDDSGLRALAEAAREQDPAQRMAKLEQALDLDRFISFIAMEVMVCHWDGYALNRNNWRIFHDLDTRRMVFFPHGMDQMFGVRRSTPESSILPYMEGMVARAVVGTAEGRRRYLERMGCLYTNVFKTAALLKRVDELAAVVRPAIAASSLQSARAYDEEVQQLKERIAQRARSLDRQLAKLAATPRLGSNGVVRLAGWKSNVQAGKPDFRGEQGPDGLAALHIAAAGANTVGSWRTTALLEPGSYRFEGRLRTKDVRPGPGQAAAGAGLRISGGTARQQLAGSHEWQNFTYSFEVAEDEGEVDFICELRAAEGEAWFDRASLRAVRVR